MKHLLIAFSIISFAFSAVAKSNDEFKNVFAFGDSFTVKGTWSDVLMSKYGVVYVDGKTGFAGGNATTLDLVNQLANYKRNVGAFDSNALYLVFMGPSDSADAFNDVYNIDSLDLLNAAGITINNAGQITNGTAADLARAINNSQINLANVIPDTLADINNRATAQATFVKDISNSGAKYVVVFNSFNDFHRQNENVYLIPADMAVILTKLWAKEYNNAMYKKLAEISPNANIILVDMDRLTEELIKEPAKYFTADQINNSFRNQGLFDNTSHPTTAGHKIISEYVASIIESPSRVAILREIAVNRGLNHFHKISNLGRVSVSNQPTSLYDIVIDVDYNNISTGKVTKRNLGIKQANSVGSNVGANFYAAENLMVGANIGMSKADDVVFEKKHGKASVDEVNYALHAVYNLPSSPIFIYGTVGAGNIDYKITREVNLGIGKNIQNGKTKGNHYMAMLGSGYKYAIAEDASIIPFVNAGYQKVSMKPYKESGAVRSTTMAFNIPERISMLGEVGATLEKDFNFAENKSLLSYITLSYGHEFANTLKKQAKGRVSDMPRDFSVPMYKAKSHSLYVQTGATMNLLNNVFVGVNLGAKPLGLAKDYSVGLSASLKM